MDDLDQIVIKWILEINQNETCTLTREDVKYLVKIVSDIGKLNDVEAIIGRGRRA